MKHLNEFSSTTPKAIKLEFELRHLAMYDMLPKSRKYLIIFAFRSFQLEDIQIAVEISMSMSYVESKLFPFATIENEMEMFTWMFKSLHPLLK